MWQLLVVITYGEEVTSQVISFPGQLEANKGYESLTTNSYGKRGVFYHVTKLYS